MTDDAIRDLIERVERAEGPLFALDCAIGQALRPDRESWPAYSASIDAAMTLVPKGWTRSMFDADNGDALARLEFEGETPSADREVHARGETWALALVAASLRARLTTGA